MKANSNSICLIMPKWVSLLFSRVIKWLVISIGNLASPWAIMLNANGLLFSSGLASNLEGSAMEHLQSWLRINMCYGWDTNLHILNIFATIFIFFDKDPLYLLALWWTDSGREWLRIERKRGIQSDSWTWVTDDVCNFQCTCIIILWDGQSLRRLGHNQHTTS